MLRAAITLYDALLGCALLFAPWTRVWQQNWLFWQSGDLQSLLMSGPVRGAVSGFGAAFLIRAAGRLAGVALVDGDEEAPQGPAEPHLHGSSRPDPIGEGTPGPQARDAAPAGIRER